MKKKEKSTEFELKVENPVEVEENTELTDAETETADTETAELQFAEELEEESEMSANKLPPNVQEIKDRWWLKYVITFAVLAVFTVLVAWVRGAFISASQKELLGKLSDAFFVPGILAVCFGLLIVASNGGTFDMLAYGVRTLFRLFRKDPKDRKYGGFYEYRKARQEKKRTFWYLVIVGGVFTLIGAALLGGYLAI